MTFSHVIDGLNIKTPKDLVRFVSHKGCTDELRASLAPDALVSDKDRGLLQLLATAATDVAARIVQQVNRNQSSTDCWLWRGSKNQKQYGQIRLRVDGPGKGTVFMAHRVVYALVWGSLPEGQVICHHCDTPACINPHHLFIGTQADNLRDAASKERFSVPRERKLTLEERLYIYNAPRDKNTGAQLARKFGISKVAVCLTRRGRFIGSPLHPIGSGPLPDSRPAHPVQQPANSPFERVDVRLVELPVRGEVH